VAGKWLAKEENGRSDHSNSEEEVELTMDKGGNDPELGNSNSGSGNGNLGSGNDNPSEEEDQREEQQTRMYINMVSTIPTEFCELVEDVAELTLDAGRVVFEKLENPRAHMKPLYIRGHLDGTPIGHLLVDGGASINILLLSLFKNLGHIESDLKYTNFSLTGFAGDPTEAKRIICKELTVGSKTML
jgi:hypothetical protein